jgi:hypothetical protein
MIIIDEKSKNGSFLQSFKEKRIALDAGLYALA